MWNTTYLKCKDNIFSIFEYVTAPIHASRSYFTGSPIIYRGVTQIIVICTPFTCMYPDDNPLWHHLGHSETKDHNYMTMQTSYRVYSEF